MIKIKKYENRGITLIALVITIIVLLILAGVAIAMLTQENGILKMMNEAIVDTTEGEVKEEVSLIMNEYAGEKYTNGTDLGTFLEQKSKEENSAIQKVTDNNDGTYTLRVKEYNVIVKDDGEIEELVKIDPEEEAKKAKIEEILPEGFVVSSNEAEDELHEGLVVIDKKGNQWVWVIVPKTDEVYPTATTSLTITDSTEESVYTLIENDLNAYTAEYKTDATYSDTHLENSPLTVEEYYEIKREILKGIYEKEGFFVARYEMGFETGDEVFSMPDLYPKGSINLNTAQTLAESMGDINVDTRGTLMFGFQWDLILKFIEEYSEGSITRDQLVNNGIDIGNYKNSQFPLYSTGKYSADRGVSYLFSEEKPLNIAWVITTGSSEKHNMVNIYDIAGNMREWTLETKPADKFYILRGADYTYTARSNTSAANRNLGGYYSNQAWLSGRAVLY